jgi:hypothetical protein
LNDVPRVRRAEIAPTKIGAAAGGMMLRCRGSRPTPKARKRRVMVETSSSVKAEEGVWLGG